MSEEKYVGTVLWFDARLGYGFIGRADDKDLFVHWSDVTCEGFKTLKKGQEVAFSLGTNKREQPKAINVVIINPEATEEASEDGEEDEKEASGS